MGRPTLDTNKSGQITVRVTKNDDEFLNNLVEQGEYVTKGEAVRHALRDMKERLAGKKGEERHESA